MGRTAAPGVENVTGRLVDCDVADFTWFRVMCEVWMDNNDTKKPYELDAHIMDHRFQPHRWILLTNPAFEPTPTRRRVLNVAIRKIIKVDDLSELDGHAWVLGSIALPEGMLVVRKERSYRACLQHRHQPRR